MASFDLAKRGTVQVTRSTQAKDLLGAWLGLAQAQTAAFDIVAHGSSLLQGTNSGALAAAGAGNRVMIIYRLLHLLRQRYAVPGVVGARGVAPGYDSNTGPVWTGTAVTQVLGGMGNSAGKFAVGTIASYFNQYCTSIAFRFSGTTSADAVTVAIDGGTAVAVPVGVSGDVVWNSGALSPTNHTIVITGTAGTPILKSSTFRNGDETVGVRMTQCSKAGSKLTDWLTSHGGDESWLTEMALTTPLTTPDAKLVIIDQLANDAPSYSAALYYGYMNELIAKYRTLYPNVPIVLLGFYRRVTTTPALVEPWDNYVAKLRQIADETPYCSFFNIDDLVDITQPFTSFLAGDTYHPSSVGQGVVADLLGEFVVPAGVSSGDQRPNLFRGHTEVLGLDATGSALTVRAGGPSTGNPFEVVSADAATTFFNVDYTGRAVARSLRVWKSDGSAPALVIDRNAGNLGDLSWATAGVTRASWRLDNAAETGSNAGSNMALNLYDDGGAFLGSAFTIVRSTQQVAIGNLKVANGAGTAPSFTVSGNAATLRQIAFATGASSRWLIGTGNAAESGSDAGSDFSLASRTDAGAAKTTIFSIARSNSRLTWGDGVHHAYGTTTGTQHGVAANQKQAFWGATPIVQPTGTPAAATDLATALTLLNFIRSTLLAEGLSA